jgi:hypothetical protein
MTMPAGRYYVGDLCYVMHDRWDEFCSLTCSGNNVLDGEFNLKDGTRFATFTTRWGDGCYYDEQGNDYPVDAGLIGCINVRDIAVSEFGNIVNGRVFEFDKDFAVSSENGVIRIGNVVIDTDAEDIDEEEEDEVY